MMLLVLPTNKHETTSSAKRLAYIGKFLNSAFLCNVEPYAIFTTTESAALFICEDKINNSSFGKLVVNE
jgi:hypothetical protein